MIKSIRKLFEYTFIQKKKKHIKSITIMFLFLANTVTYAQKQITAKSDITIKSSKSTLNYMLYEPKNTQTPQALIIFLHGSGEKGTDLNKVAIHGPMKYIKTHDLDTYILAPQCPENKLWNSEELYQLVQEIIQKYKIDTNRIYLTGLSLGGWGSWNLASTHPELFAAVMPICGMVDRIPLFEAEKLKNIPIQIFHGVLDDIVPMEESIQMYRALKKAGNTQVHLTLFDDANHDSWSRVYDNPTTYQWLLEQKKK